MLRWQLFLLYPLHGGQKSRTVQLHNSKAAAGKASMTGLKKKRVYTRHYEGLCVPLFKYNLSRPPCSVICISGVHFKARCAAVYSRDSQKLTVHVTDLQKESHSYIFVPEMAKEKTLVAVFHTI